MQFGLFVNSVARVFSERKWSIYLLFKVLSLISLGGNWNWHKMTCFGHLLKTKPNYMGCMKCARIGP